MSELANLSDDELSNLLNAVLSEQERRQRMARVPSQIAAMTKQYVEDGGDKSVIMGVLEEARPVVD